ncbi:TetR family transcriptional regulator [Mycolicibacterium murale]|uniref:TetR family transcriptional regulator n=1 Tax=Mycolicibacterium murale TaxID=182220 RepID=A0A7I9WMR9_9MYCO|nr:TetR/AcrR family transcriptional regulator [Mycolicibacterium murale]GFG59041.1 TetR family transcriptional regulator [Mycolicibacterium murale]
MTRIDPRVARNTAAALTAARELLLEQGWEAVTHVAVAARSGVGRTTLYRHWPDAAAMLREVVTTELDVRIPPATGRLRDDLIATVEVFRSQLHNPAMERIMRVNIERSSVDPAFRRIKEALFAEGRRTYQQIFDAARASGDLDTDVDVSRATERLLGPLLFRRMLGDEDFGHEYVIDVVDDFLTLHTAGR